MPQVITISSQPTANDIVSVYRPIIFGVNIEDTTPPKIVYCDVYVNGIYYRTLSKTQYKRLNVDTSDWEFDIQDPCQEVLGKHLPAYGGSDVILAGPCTASITVKFRGSTIDADGFLVPEGTVPVQGTGTSSPVSGDGLASNEFYILNVALQHHHNQVLSSHLSAYKNGIWDLYTFPMSHRKNNYEIENGSNDYYPIFYKGSGVISKLKLFIRNIGQVTWFNHTADVTVVNEAGEDVEEPTKGLYYIPNGPKNLASLFPTINWRNLKEYYVQVLDDTNAVIATTVVNKMLEWESDDNARIYFLNDCGTYDAINFMKPKAQLEDSSSEFQKSVNYPLKKSDAAINRFNVRGNRSYEVRRYSVESEMEWLEECKRSIEAFMDWAGTENQDDDYMAIFIVNGKMDSLKNVADHTYEFILLYKLGNEQFSIRN